MIRRARLDFATTSFAFHDAAPTPAMGTATRTPEGYLDVDAYIARDGCLRYSDGITSWHEYRPAAAIDAAAASFAHLYVTDDHPPQMLDAANASKYVRGVVIGTPTVEVIDGVSYLRARLSIRDAALITKIDAGQHQLSIGFWSNVRIEKGVAPDGTRFDAVQDDLVGNHVASVKQGRAGAAVRVLMDSVRAAVHSVGATMRILQLTAAQIAGWVSAARRADEAGMPTTESKIIGPDGTELMVPTWIAAAIEELIELKKGSAKEAAPPPPSGEAPPPPPPGDSPSPPPPGAKPEDEKKEPPMTQDQINALVRSRVRLESLAKSVELPIVDSNVDLARSIVAKVLPDAGDVAKLDGFALDFAIDLAEKTLAKRPKIDATRNPWERPVAVKTDGADDYDERQAKILRDQGVRI